MGIEDVVMGSNGRPYVLRVRKSGHRKGELIKDYGIIRVCKVCGNKFLAKDIQLARTNGHFCSKSCAKTLSNHPRWKGGVTRHSDGYVLVRTSDGLNMRHRLIVEKRLGRKLLPGEQVHHINGIRNDNRPGNLMVLSISEHARLHGNLKRMARA